MASLRDIGSFQPKPTDVPNLYIGNVKPSFLSRLQSEQEKAEAIEDEEEKKLAHANILHSMFTEGVFVGEDGSLFDDVDVSWCLDMEVQAQHDIMGAFSSHMEALAKKPRAPAPSG